MLKRRRIRAWWLARNGLPPDHDELPVFNWWFLRYIAIMLVAVIVIEYALTVYLEPVLRGLLDRLF